MESVPRVIKQNESVFWWCVCAGTFSLCWYKLALWCHKQHQWMKSVFLKWDVFSVSVCSCECVMVHIVISDEPVMNSTQQYLTVPLPLKCNVCDFVLCVLWLRMCPAFEVWRAFCFYTADADTLPPSALFFLWRKRHPGSVAWATGPAMSPSLMHTRADCQRQLDSKHR